MEFKRAVEGEKGFEKVFAFLRDRLVAGSLKPGDRLISERDLATQLGVSRPLVREALRALSMLGIVEIQERIGTVVTRPDVSVLNDFFTFALAQQADMPDDVCRPASRSSARGSGSPASARASPISNACRPPSRRSDKRLTRPMPAAWPTSNSIARSCWRRI